MTVHHLPPAGDASGERRRRQRHASASAIRQYIEGRVLDGGLQPGQCIDEGALASQFNVSRTPVREAGAAQRCAQLADTPGVDPGDYFEANQAFHKILFRGSHNEYLCETTMALNHRLVPYRRFRLLSHARMKVSSREHSAIAEVVIERLAAKAAVKMRNHITIQSALLSELAARLPTSYLDTA